MDEALHRTRVVTDSARGGGQLDSALLSALWGRDVNVEYLDLGTFPYRFTSVKKTK